MRLLLATLALPLLPACGSEQQPIPPAPPAARPPNLLVISIDTLRADRLGCYGYDKPTSPNIDALALESCVFDAAQSASSWTLPSMSTLMTGMTASTHQATQLSSRLDPSQITLAELLRDAGFDTAIVASHVFLTTSYGLQQGYTHVDSSVVQDEQDITSHEVADKGIRWIREQAGSRSQAPWMLWLHFFDPHAPYLVHPGLSEAFGVETDLQRYDGEIAYTDLHVGRLLEALRASPDWNETVVVIVADHGEEFGEHGHFGHGYSLHEECVRVPLIVRVPGLAPQRVAEPVPTIDLVPTLLELTNTPWKHQLPGVSLVPALRSGLQIPRRALSEVSWQTRQDIRCVQAEGWKYFDFHLGKYDAELLFDKGADRAEQSNLFEQQPERGARLSELLQEELFHSRRLAKNYQHQRPGGLSPAEEARLSQLGYSGDEASGGVPREKK
jgi:arylsulfatase A-like enzyme